jgi:hypothetical protein
MKERGKASLCQDLKIQTKGGLNEGEIKRSNSFRYST